MKAIALIYRAKARDMYDFSFLSAMSKLNFEYVANKLQLRGVVVDSPDLLKELILIEANAIDMKEKGYEISLFLIQKSNVLRVTSFC